MQTTCDSRFIHYKIIFKIGTTISGYNSASLSTQLKCELIYILLFASIIFRYGHHVSKNSYYICHDQQVIKSLFERIRNFDGAPNTVSVICLLESALLDVLVMSDIRLWTQDRHTYIWKFLWMDLWAVNWAPVVRCCLHNSNSFYRSPFASFTGVAFFAGQTDGSDLCTTGPHAAGYC